VIRQGSGSAPSPQPQSCPSLLQAPSSSPNPSPKKETQRREKKVSTKEYNLQQKIKLSFRETLNFPGKVGCNQVVMLSISVLLLSICAEFPPEASWRHQRSKKPGLYGC